MAKTKNIHPVIQVIISPFTVYLFLGTVLLFILYKFESLIKKIGMLTNSVFYRNELKVEKYHKKGIGYTIFFFVVFPFILFKDIILFIGAGTIFLYEYSVNVVEFLYEKVIEQTQLVWEKITEYFN